MDLLSTLISGFLFFLTIITPYNPQTSQVNLEIDSQQLVFYNYTYVSYSSPFALNYSYLLFGNLFEVEQIKEVQKNIPLQQPTNQFSLDWLIAIEKNCPLPNNAMLELITEDSKYTIEKLNFEFKIKELACTDCDITIFVYEYPSSKEEAKKFMSEGKIKIKLNKNILSLLWKGYGSTYYCLTKL